MQCISGIMYLLGEVYKLADGLEGIGVVARLSTLALEHVLDDGGMTNLLVGHVLDEVPILSRNTGRLPLLDGELSKSVMETVRQRRCQPLLI
jgi:hypothetical protein